MLLSENLENFDVMVTHYHHIEDKVSYLIIPDLSNKTDINFKQGLCVCILG